jgi:hypothetical protein
MGEDGGRPSAAGQARESKRLSGSLRIYDKRFVEGAGGEDKGGWARRKGARARARARVGGGEGWGSPGRRIRGWGGVGEGGREGTAG